MSLKSHISLIDLSRQLPFELDGKLKQDICFGETLIISCGHRDGDVDDRSSESEWTCSEPTSTEISEKVKEHKISTVEDTVEEEIKGEAEDEEDDFQFFFFPDCKKPTPAQHSQSSIVMVDGLPKINLAKTVHSFCTCKRDKKGECECFTKLPCLCGAKLKADCTCRELKDICTCGLGDPSPKCTCVKAAVCTCDPDGKIIPVCVCDDIEKPCFCNMPSVFPSPVCKCKCKPKDLKNTLTNVSSGDESVSSMEAIEGESSESTIKEQCRKQLCNCQKPEPKKLCYCKKGNDCVCRIACICGVQKTCMCEPTDSEDIPCKDAEHKSICSCDLPKICDCNSNSDIVCDCFPPKICTCGDPEHCKCSAVCTCQKPCLCDVVSTKEKVCTCFDTPTGLSEILCTCPKPENKNLKRVRAGKHGYRWCNEVDPHHTYFDFAYDRHKNLEKKESEPEKFVIQGLHDEKKQEECPIHATKPPKYEKKVRKPSLDCCSAVGGISVSVETLGEDKDKFLVQVVSHSSKEGAKTGSKLVSIVDCNLHTLEENRAEHITKKRLTKEKRSYIAICENGYYNKVTRICGDKHVIRRIYHTFEKAHDFLLEGANVIIMRYLAINRYKGHIKTDTVMMDGLICQSVYVCHGVSEAIVNGTPLQVIKLERHIIEPSGFIHQTLTVFTLRGYMVSHEWADSCYILHINPLLRINTTKDEIEPHAPLREKWRDDLQLLSDYLDFKTVRTSEGGRYITESGALTSVVRDYLQAILLLRPQDTLNFTRHYFGTVLSSLDLPHEDYFDPASRHVRYHFLEE